MTRQALGRLAIPIREWFRLRKRVQKLEAMEKRVQALESLVGAILTDGLEIRSEIVMIPDEGLFNNLKKPH